MKHRTMIVLLIVLLAASAGPALAQDGSESQAAEPLLHPVQVGDTWDALSRRYGVSREALQAANPHPNPYRQPAIGSTIQVPAAQPEQPGLLLRRDEGGLLRLAARHRLNPWALARLNGIGHPYRPLFERALFIPGGSATPRELPAGLASLELSAVPALPGRALAYRATASEPLSLTVKLGGARWDSFANGGNLVGLGATGAFFRPEEPELSIVPAGGPAWSQPWRFVPGTWDYDQVTLTGAAAQIDAAAIQAERERLFQIWSVRSPAPQWQAPFREPLQSYLHLSSNYGARRSYNGGPYSTYHEGVDFAAYGGTPVVAAAGGTVVLAEELYVRGGAVIIDHGLGIYSGYYHMSAVHARPGQVVQPGDLLGEVGTTGLSSGNHLHWDLLVAETWVDAAAWKETGMACWLLGGWGTPCTAESG